MVTTNMRVRAIIIAVVDHAILSLLLQKRGVKSVQANLLLYPMTGILSCGPGGLCVNIVKFMEV